VTQALLQRRIGNPYRLWHNSGEPAPRLILARSTR
jgi:hypothetical protein